MAETVLVVEDHDRVRDLLQSVLRSGGYQVETAADGAEGLEKALALRPALVILDVMLPEMNGYEVLEALRAHEDQRALPVLVLTALAEPPFVEQILKLGADDCLQKPVNQHELLARVRGLIAVREFQSEEERLFRYLEELRRGEGDSEELALLRSLSRDEPPTVLVGVAPMEIMELIGAYLAEGGCRWLPAGDEAEVIEAALREPPDVILLGMHLPPHGAGPVLERLAADERTRDCPVLVAAPGDVLWRWGEQTKMLPADFVTLPMEEHELRRRVKAYARLRKVHRALSRLPVERR